MSNLLHGGRGDDRVDGCAGADTLAGGIGSDTYVVDDVGDVVIELSGGGSADHAAAAAVGYTLAEGNNGDNRLEGQGGNDTLRGLGGRDSFVFADPLGPDNVDTILDFDPLDDRFLMSNDIFSGFGDRTGEILPGHLRVNTTGEAQDASDMIIYDSDDGFLYYDADGFGAGDRVHFATIDADLAITNSDFVLA